MMARDKGWSKKAGKCLVLGMTLVLGLSSYQAVNASNLLNHARNMKSEAESQLSSTNSQISQIESEQMHLKSEIQALDGQLVNVIVNLNTLLEDLQAKEEELVQVQADLEQAKVDEHSQHETMKKRIQFMYERGDSAFLSSLLDSGSFAELLNRVEYYSGIYDYDRELLFAYKDAKERVIELEGQVKGTIAEMGQIQLNYEEEQRQFEAMIAERQGRSADYDSKLEAAQALVSQYHATIQEQNRIIREEQERIAREEAERRERERQEEARRAAEAEAARKAAEAEAARQAEQARRAQEEEARKAQAEAAKKAQAEAARQAEQARREQEEKAKKAKAESRAENETKPASAPAMTPSSISPGSQSPDTDGMRTATFRATAYCPCTICCGQWSGNSRTASGTVPTAGRTIAVDPRVIPLGSKVNVKMPDGSIHTYIAEDTGSGIKGNIIDIYFSSHSQAVSWGVKNVIVWY